VGWYEQLSREDLLDLLGQRDRRPAFTGGCSAMPSAARALDLVATAEWL
jgi:hypothetical protein